MLVTDQNGDEIFEGDEAVDTEDVAVDDPVFITEDITDEWYNAD